MGTLAAARQIPYELNGSMIVGEFGLDGKVRSINGALPVDGSESSAAIRARVEAARKVQEARFAPLGKPNMLVNGDMGPACTPLSSSGGSNNVQTLCAIDKAGKGLTRAAVKQMELGARAYHRVLKLGRTFMQWAQSAITDLAGKEVSRTEHLSEGLQYRPGGGV